QLKYTSYIIAIAVGISAVLGTFLYLTSRDVVQQGHMVVEESKKVSDVVRINITKDPIYSDNPELAAAFASGALESDKKIEDQQARLENQQQRMLYTLVGALTLMVFLI